MCIILQCLQYFLGFLSDVIPSPQNAPNLTLVQAPAMYTVEIPDPVTPLSESFGYLLRIEHEINPTAYIPIFLAMVMQAIKKKQSAVYPLILMTLSLHIHNCRKMEGIQSH